MIPDRSLRQRRRRRWDRVSWWYSLILIVPLIGFVATLAWSSSAEDDGSGIRGIVRDAWSGDPVGGAVVSTANATATTNDDGKFTIDDLTATSLAVTRDEYESTQVAIVSLDESLEIQLRPTTVRGTVKNKKTGDPMPGVTVSATGRTGESVSTVTDDDGKYVLTNVPADAEVSITYDGFTVISRPVGTNAKLDFEIRPDRLTGRVTDMEGRPLAGATVSIGAAVATTTADGTYSIAAVPESGTIVVRKAGFSEVSGELPDSLQFDAQLQEFDVRALYVNAATIASEDLWLDMLRIAEETEINALVLDLKDSSGEVAYDSQVPLARQTGAVQPQFDLVERLDELRSAGVYAIARIVVFEDPLLAGQRNDLAIQDVTTGGVWTTWDGRPWVNPHAREVWQYNIDLAVEAAELGFDEIQFDYIRFPTDGDLNIATYGAEYANTTRVDAISGFLGEAQSALRDTDALLAVNIAGLTLFDESDGGIGQNLEAIEPLVDIICPMVFPAYFYPGQMGLDIPNNHPYEVVSRSLQWGSERLPAARDKLRPWLQDFSFGEGIEYGEAEVAAQIQAAQDFDANGWMLWSLSSQYHEGALSAGS